MGNSPSAERSKKIGVKSPREMAEENKDISMLDVTEANKLAEPAKRNSNSSLTHSFSHMNIDGANNLEAQPPLARRKSTLIFNDEDDEIPPYTDHQEHGSEGLSHTTSNEEQGGNNETVSSVSVSASATPSDTSLDNVTAEQSVGDSKTSPMPAVSQTASYIQSGNNQQQNRNSPKPAETMVPVDITWQQGGHKVYVTGSFTGWRKMIGLVPVVGQPGLLHVKLQLPVGTHRFRFIVDDELRFSDFLPTATDQMGNFVNYLEVVAPNDTVSQQQQLQNQQLQSPQQLQQEQQHQHQLQQLQNIQDNPQTPQVSEIAPGAASQPTSSSKPVSARSRIALEIEREPDEIGDGFTRFREKKPSRHELEYTQDIPAVFTDPTVMEQYYLTLDQQQNNHQNMSWLTPPQLPPHLENVPLNSYSSSQGDNNENNSGALPIPNHVVLNHLATSSIKHNTLCVASIVRYKRKYVTQILYAPLQ
ncbi:hypothetical protein HG535_0B02470 [Zygotorulaspora mrakii]|uniref:Association with the SNF1 complex (ASC) domain-containing protein n=1 Tax=Zygotorulaspora mrakii TaxID=42260 RepID=A0A7H9AXR7_ZYGMR|nr:uncharacterized protein HG535_0B02470 [Zygotorulaspora mrakii]QLG71208.1 hypothetical protein HG535_0B02470 [Zygotorulaspora mrakii]